MKKSSLIILISVVILVVVIGGFLLMSSKRLDWDPCDSPELNNALNKKEVSLCYGVPDKDEHPFYENYCMERCVGTIATKTDKMDLCSNISDLIEVADSEGWVDPTKTGSLKDYCYLTFAKRQNNLSICELLETDWAKSHCGDMVEQFQNSN